MAPGTTRLSRRSFVAAGAATIMSAGLSRRQKNGLTAEQVIGRIKAEAGVPWRDQTVDTFKAGDPATVVTGIATTAMATLGVLQRAAATGRNLIVTHEPAYYASSEDPGPRASDPVYLAKKAFIEQHRLVVWRFFDHWLARRPSELATALASALGWTNGRDAAHDRIYTIAPASVGAVAAHVRARLGISGGMRVVGRSDMPVRRVLLSPGTTDLLGTVADLRSADLVLSGEPREWEAVEYVADTASGGTPKALVAVGRVVSEEPGMRACAVWLRALFPGLPVDAIPTGDPYWRPTL